MGPKDKKELTEEELLQDEEYVEMLLDENDLMFESADFYDDAILDDDEIDDARLRDEKALLAKYGF